MIEGLKPYPEYKDSGLPWLGNIPAHWDTPRLGSLLRERGETNEAREMTQVLSVMKDIGVIRYEDKGNVGNKKSEDTARYKIVRPDDIVVNCMNVIIGSVGISQYTGCLSPVYYVLTRRYDNDNPRYLNAIFQTKPYQKSLVRIGSGIMAHRMRIPMELLKCELLLKPPREEQDAIVRFLDHANGRIERFIRTKKKLIALLNEQKQAIIHRAVTRGLDPNVRLKPSGVPWLGDIPEHWEMRRLRQIVSISPSKSESIGILQSGRSVTFLPMEKVGTNGGIDTSINVPPHTVWNGFTYFRRGDVIVAKITPCFENGKGAFLQALPTEIGFGSTEFHVLRPSALVCGEYLRVVTSSSLFLTNGANSMVGSAGQKRVPTDFIKNYPFPLPSVVEQLEILESLAQSTSELNKIITRTEQEIALLRECRTRLVSDVVTGQLDVREAAKHLPAEVEAEPILDGDELMEEIDGDESEAE